MYLHTNSGEHRRVMKQVTAEIPQTTMKAEISFIMDVQLVKKKLIHFQIISVKGLTTSPNSIFQKKSLTSPDYLFVENYNSVGT